MRGWHIPSLWIWAFVAGMGIVAQTWLIEITLPVIAALLPLEGGEAHVMRAFAMSFGILIGCQALALSGQVMFMLRIPTETNLLPWQRILRWLPIGMIALLAVGTWRLLIFGELVSNAARLFLVAAWLVSTLILTINSRERSAAAVK